MAREREWLQSLPASRRLQGCTWAATRYVDNRLLLYLLREGKPLVSTSARAEDFYGAPVVLEAVGNSEFVGVHVYITELTLETQYIVPGMGGIQPGKSLSRVLP
eukprot:6543614-Pyramimonas_sp.AAC.1